MGNLARWLADKDAEGLIARPPGVLYDQPGRGIVLMDPQLRALTLLDHGDRLELVGGLGTQLSPAHARELAAALDRFADRAGHDPQNGRHRHP